MTGRIPLDDLTSDQLDALYDERDAVQERLDHAERNTMPRLHRCIEDDAEMIRHWQGRAETAEVRVTVLTDDRDRQMDAKVKLLGQLGNALAEKTAAEAAIERVLSPVGIRAAAEAIGDEALTHLGRDLGTIHVERIAEAGLRAALDQPQQPTCVCGEPTTPRIVHRADGPCHMDEQPTV
ncbi:hypothetical protein ACFU98_35165 [Streptomyces sp. NPDC057575]|uniref:hypothetical protein n=1 Tax=unclassified Streptomyces TaxID=2593676 RepID=UPI0036918DDC